MMRTSFVFPLFILLIYAFLLAPLLVVVAVSFDATGTFQFPPSMLSVEWYVKVFDADYFVHAFWVSLIVALGVALFTTLLGGLAAIALVRFTFVGRDVVSTVFLAPIMLPDILFGAALLLFYGHGQLRGTLAAILIGHMAIALPFVIRTISAGLAGTSLTLEEAAMSLGASPFQAFVKITGPLIRSSVLSAAIFAFIISSSDINLALFLTGAGTVTLPVVIYSQLVSAADPTIAAASTLQIALIGILLAIVQRSFRLRVA